MRYSSTVVPTGFGAYTFNDTDGVQRRIPWLAFATPDGQEQDRATCASGFDPVAQGLVLFHPVALDFETYTADSKRKLRCHGRADAGLPDAA